jgi:hypothetical protein
MKNTPHISNPLAAHRPPARKTSLGNLGKLLGLVAAGLGAVATSAFADTTIQATFNDNTNGSLIGQQGGVGFLSSSAWNNTVGSGPVTVVAGDLAAPTYVNTHYGLTQSGTAQHIYGTGSSTILTRTIDGGGLTNTNHAVWFSFLARVDSNGRAGINIDDPQNSPYNRVLVRNNTTSTATEVQLYIDPSTSVDLPGSSSLVGSNLLVVGRLTYNTAGTVDTVDVWVNPDVTSPSIYASSVGAGQGSSHSMDWDTASSGVTAPGIQSVGVVAYQGGYVDNFMMSDTTNAYSLVTGYNPPPACPAITLGAVQKNAVVGASYNQTNSAIGGTGPYTYATQANGTLPPGLSLSPAGVLSGTPTTVGAYSFGMLATDANGCIGTNSYEIAVYGSGQDNSADSTAWGYGNEGVGFGPWSFNATTHSGNNAYAGWETDTLGNDTASNVLAANDSIWKLYAVGFGTSPWEEADAYRSFNTPLGAAGDVFAVSFELEKINDGVSTNGQIGFALRNGNVTGDGNWATFARLQVYQQGNTNLWVQDAAGARQIPGVLFTRYGYNCVVTLTGPNTYSLSVVRYTATGVSVAPVVVTGTLAGSGPMDSLSLFNWNNDLAAGYNSDVYFNNVAYTATTPLITNSVTFQVDMSLQIAAGRFNPGAGDTVEVRGSFENWTAGQYVLAQSPTNANVYTGTVPIVGAVGSGESYKFVFTDSAFGTVFEASAPKYSTLDTGAPDYDRFFELPNAAAVTFPAVLFGDSGADDYLPSDTTVTFWVNMTGAVGSDGRTFDPTNSGDSLWINGDFTGWYAWYDPENPTQPPSQYQLTPVGSGYAVYSVTLTIPKGTPVSFAYKYGVGIGTNGDLGPRNTEPGQDHSRVLRSTATGSYSMPQDTFGVGYQEPLFSSTNRSGGQLAIGAAAGGVVPVTWLGRPGAHIQSAGAVAGPWTDHFETDGTNWAAGFGSTNGLVSQTNWPVSNNAFFRLVKP